MAASIVMPACPERPILKDIGASPMEVPEGAEALAHGVATAATTTTAMGGSGSAWAGQM
jgi:hypothetical protein